MIIDTIGNAGNYAGLVKNLDRALAFLKSAGELTLGQHDFEGGRVIASEGVPVPLADKDFEAHRDYADVMFVLSGSETVSYCPINELETVKEYDGAGDCSMHQGQGKDIVVTVPAGYFYIVMPGEGHKPCVHLGDPVPYTKYIIKCKQ